jgi:hypothetical protein
MAITRATGFPVSDSGLGTGTAVAGPVFTPAAIGDLLIFSFGITSETDLVTSVTGGPAASWSRAHRVTYASSGYGLHIYWAKSTTTTGSAPTINMSSSSTVSFCSYDEFTTGSSIDWNCNSHNGSSGSSTTCTWPSLSQSDDGMYWGSNCVQTSATGGSGAGFVFTNDAVNNMLCENVNCTAGNAYQPSCTCGNAWWMAAGAMFSAGVAEPPETPTLYVVQSSRYHQ